MDTKIRVCRECMYPVGILSERPEFVCLLKYNRMEIEQTTQISTSEYELPKLVTSRNDMIEERKKLRK